MKRSAYDLRISKWAGRLGNNIIQVRNCLHMAFVIGSNVKLPPNSYFNKTYIAIHAGLPSNKDIVDVFWFPNRIARRTFLVDDRHFREVDEVIRRLLFVPPEKALDLDDKTLVVHIRSGDIFKSKKPDPRYIQPPLEFYTRIIEGLGDKIDTIRLIAEDSQNPCINILRKKYANLVFEPASLAEDIRTIIGAKRIVFGMGTFVPQLLTLNSSFTQVYRPGYSLILPYIDHEFKDNVVDVHDYIQKIKRWNNTPEQRQIMCTYKFPKFRTVERVILEPSCR